MKKMIVILLGIALFGCSPVSTRLKSTLAPAANIGDSVTCGGGCMIEWERAQIWIARHSRWKIQVSTDVQVQTYSSVRGDPSYGFSITKEPVGSGKYVIRMELVCGNMFGCDPKPLDVKNAFYYYVLSGVDLLEGQGPLSGLR